MHRGKIRKMFPGSNSAYGFYSFYDQIIEDSATRIFVIKGGPGVGKSTFMQNIARELIKKAAMPNFTAARRTAPLLMESSFQSCRLPVLTEPGRTW